MVALLGSRTEYANSRKELLQGLEQWRERLQGKDFHGGDKPDEADF
jgi:hypothetical protein